MKRLFCSVDVPGNKEIEAATNILQQSLSNEKINWVAPDNYHLTLKFFGNTSEDKIKDVIDALSKSTSLVLPFSFSVEGCGFFGKKNKPSVVWLGIKNTSGLEKLYNAANSALLRLGYLPDKPSFVPHLTIGRIKSLSGPVDTERLIIQLSNKVLAKVNVGSFRLMESILRPQGPSYSVVEEFWLDG